MTIENTKEGWPRPYSEEVAYDHMKYNRRLALAETNIRLAQENARLIQERDEARHWAKHWYHVLGEMEDLCPICGWPREFDEEIEWRVCPCKRCRDWGKG